jgi:hypothetical protein
MKKVLHKILNPLTIFIVAIAVYVLELIDWFQEKPRRFVILLLLILIFFILL